MSSAATFDSRTVTFLLELDPMDVYRKARDLVCRYPESGPVVTEVISSYSKLLCDLHDDFAVIGEALP